LRKFFVTQLTNHGVEDKVVNFFIGHKIPEERFTGKEKSFSIQFLELSMKI